MIPTSTTFRSGLVLLLLVAVAFVLHFKVLGLSFFSDDFSVLHRIGVKNDLGTGSFFRPLSEWTLYLNYLFSGPSPIAFRSVNVLLLGINAWLVFLLFRTFFGEGASRHSALVAALLFVSYPFHSEPQVWIIGRGTALATGSILAALLFASGPYPLWKKVVAVALCSALGPLCYESALSIPLFLCVLMFRINAGERHSWYTVVLVSGVLVFINLLLRAHFTGHLANAYGRSFFQRDVLEYALSGAKAFGRSFLGPDQNEIVQIWRSVVLIIIIALTATALFRKSRGEPLVRRTILIVVALLILAYGVAILGGVSTRTSESDRFLYLPSAFLCMLIAITIAHLFRGWHFAVVTGLLLVGSILLLVRGQRTWVEASRTIGRIIDRTPAAPSNGRLFVTGIPGDHNGAFIFRHGYIEALLFAGKDTSRVIRVDTIRSGSTDARGVPAWSFELPEDTLFIGPMDRIEQWTDHGFRPRSR